MIGIVGAMDQELKRFIQYVDNKEERIINGFEFIIGEINNKKIVIVKAKIGKVASSLALALLFSHFSIDYVINFGSGGGVDRNLRVGDIIIGNKIFYGDVDLTVFNYRYGQMAKCPPYFTSNIDLITKFKEVNPNQSFHEGSLICFDQFVHNKAMIDSIVNTHFKDDNILCVDMESAAIGHSCYLFNKPLLVIKAISDVIGEDDQKESFDLFVEKISDKLANLLYNFI